MAGRPPPPINVTNPKVGDMIGLGPSPSWLYTNAIKIGRTKVAIPNTNPVQYYEYDTLEYIHPTWDSSIDYSKPNMPTRVWYEGRLYTPGTWLTTSKRGQLPTVVESNVGDERYRSGMNFPPDNSELKPQNRSHSFRIWKPFTKGPQYLNANLNEVDAPQLFTNPTCLDDENYHYSSVNTATSKHFIPTPAEPYKAKIKTVGNNSYYEPEDAIIDVDPKTGVLSERGYININHEAPFSYGMSNAYDGLYGGPYFDPWQWFTGIASYGVSLGDLYSQSVISTSVTESTGTTSAGANIYTTTSTTTLGSGASDTQCFIVGYGGGAYWGGYYFYGSTLGNFGQLGSGDYFYVYPKQSMFNSSGNLVIDTTPTGTYPNSSFTRKVLYNIFREITHPLFFTRTSIGHQVKQERSGSARTTYFPTVNGYTPPPVYADTYFESNSGNDISVPAQMKAIAVGGASQKPGEWKNGIYSCDANAVGSFTWSEFSTYSYTSAPYSSYSTFKHVNIGQAYFYKYQDHG